jgi:MoxR-like ATPase
LVLLHGLCRYTLQILKEIKLDTFPLSKFIVKASDQVGPPKYFEQAEHQLNIGGRHFSPLVGPWPTAKDLSLDETQYAAFRACLSKEFAIVQGPPGTGKTFLGN